MGTFWFADWRASVNKGDFNSELTGVLLRQAFEKIAARGAKTLLLDLRDNPGGEDALGKLLFAHLVDQPFPYYEELTVKRVAYVPLTM